MKTIGTKGHTLSSRIRKLVYYLGFIISRIPDKNRLEEYTVEVRNHELKKLSHTIRQTNSQKYYNEFLKKCCSNWNCDFSSSKFIGKGLGEHSLNVFRKVCCDKHYYFEKSYFSNSISLDRVTWFYEHIYPLIGSSIKTPELKKVIKGEFLTVAYFDFIDQLPLSKGVLHSNYFDISRKMYWLSMENKEVINLAPNFTKDYTSHYHYADKIAIAEEIIGKSFNNSLSKAKIEQVINLQPLVITHGDIYYTNVFVDSTIIDWDSFGIFPHGFGIAFMVANSVKSISFERIEEILLEEYEKIVDEGLWNGFHLTCLYFYFIFTVKDANSNLNLARQKKVFVKIEELYSLCAKSSFFI